MSASVVKIIIIITPLIKGLSIGYLKKYDLIIRTQLRNYDTGKSLKQACLRYPRELFNCYYLIVLLINAPCTPLTRVIDSHRSELRSQWVAGILYLLFNNKRGPRTKTTGYYRNEGWLTRNRHQTRNDTGSPWGVSGSFPANSGTEGVD